MQLVIDGEIELFDTMKNKRIASAEVMEKFGVTPSKVVEVQALAGDSTDNVPGVRGIGVKTAAELINAFGTLEALLARTGEIRQPKRRETLIENAGNARISLKLVQLDHHVPIKTHLDEFAVRDPEPSALIGFLKAMEFSALCRRAASHFGIEDVDTLPPAPDPAQPALAGPGEMSPLPPQAMAPLSAEEAVAPAKQPPRGGTPGAVMDRAALLKKIDHDAVTGQAPASICAARAPSPSSAKRTSWSD
jgi:DNA polymerase-1